MSSDSDTLSDSSGESPSMLIVQQQQQQRKTDKPRSALAYPRHYLLSLSKSPKVKCPGGLKPLSEWYGEYEPPSHSSNTSSNQNSGGVRYNNNNTGGNARNNEQGGRGGNNRGGTGGEGYHNPQRERNTGDRSTGENNNRHERPSAERSHSASATGSMGDFRLAGAKPFNASTFGTSNKDDAPSSSSSSSRRVNGARNISGSKQEEETGLSTSWGGNSPRDQSAFSAAMAERKRSNADFTKKDGRAAEEGGWRSNREAAGGYRDRERDRRGNVGGSGTSGATSGERERDRAAGGGRRQPAWMDDSEPRRGSSGQPSRTLHEREDVLPEWATSDGLGDALESDSLEPSQSSQSHQEAVKHVDQLQAWKAEMKAIEAKKKAEEERTLRREMGLPDLPDPPTPVALEVSTPALAEQVPAPAPAKAATSSVFADFLLPKESKEKKDQALSPGLSNSKLDGESAGGVNSNVGGGAGGKGRASRFARFFDAAGNATSQPSPQAMKSPEPSHATQSSASPNPLAALLGGAGQSSVSSPQPQNLADAQSMMRLMEMLQVSSGQAQQQQPDILPLAGNTNRGPSPSQIHAQQGLIPRGEAQNRIQQNHNIGIEAPTPRQPPSLTNGPLSHAVQQHPPPQPLANMFTSPPPPPQTQQHHLLHPQSQQQQQHQQPIPPRHQVHAQGPRSPSGPVDYASGASTGIPQGSRLANRMSGNQPQIQHGRAPDNGMALQQLLQAQQQQILSPSGGSRRDFAQQAATLGVGQNGIMSPPPSLGLPSHLQQQQQQAQGMRSSSNPTGIPSEQQQQAQMAAFLAAAAQAGRLPPPQSQQQVPPQQQNINHARSPSTQMQNFDPRQLHHYQQQQQQHQQVQQQQQSSEAALARLFADRAIASGSNVGATGPANHPLPPHPQQQQQHLHQQQQYPYGLPPLQSQNSSNNNHSNNNNPLAHLLNNSQNPQSTNLGLGHPPLPPPHHHQLHNQHHQHMPPSLPPPSIQQYGFQQQQHFPPQQQQQQMSQNQNQQLQQNQIDLMALLTGARR